MAKYKLTTGAYYASNGKKYEYGQIIDGTQVKDAAGLVKAGKLEEVKESKPEPKKEVKESKPEPKK